MKQDMYPKTLKGNSNRKRDEAKQRQLYWEGLTPKQQLAELDKRPGQSLRQRARIAERMKTEKEGKK